jgi:hypothetical protein
MANSRGPESLTALATGIGASPISIVDAAKAWVPQLIGFLVRVLV